MEQGGRASPLNMHLGGGPGGGIHSRQGLERGGSLEPPEILVVVMAVGAPSLGRGQLRDSEMTVRFSINGLQM